MLEAAGLRLEGPEPPRLAVTRTRVLLKPTSRAGIDFWRELVPCSGNFSPPRGFPPRPHLRQATKCIVCGRESARISPNIGPITCSLRERLNRAHFVLGGFEMPKKKLKPAKKLAGSKTLLNPQPLPPRKPF